MFAFPMRALGALSALAFATAFPAGAALPPPWAEADIGAVGLPGSAAVSGPTWAIYGSGADIWGTADGFHFAYQRWNGNVQVSALSLGVAATDGWAKAGLMIREDLSPGSRHAFVCLTPSNGVAFQSRAAAGGESVNHNLPAAGAPRWIRLGRSGDLFTAWQSADGLNWAQVGPARLINMPPNVYVGLAATSHDNSRLGNAGFHDLRLSASPALFVAGSTSLGAGDAAAKRRLEALGYAVTVKAGHAAVTSDAAGKDLVVISSTVVSTDVGQRFSSVGVPVVTWENALLDDLGMTGPVAGVDYGTTGNQVGLGIFPQACFRATMYIASSAWGDGCHDLAAGLTGTFDAVRTSQPLSWGRPGPAALRIAFPYGNDALSSVFAYEQGAAMPGPGPSPKAPARRVFLFLGDQSAAAWTGRGQQLFDAAIRWATRTRHAITKNVLVLNYDPVLPSQGGQRMHQWGYARTGTWGGDPWPLVRDYLADLTEASGGSVRWRRVFHPAVPDYIDRWAPITGPVQFNTPAFTERDFLRGYENGLASGDWEGAARLMPNDGDYRLDYGRILSDFGVDAMIDAGEVDEVLIVTHPFANGSSNAMAGPSPYDIGGPALVRPLRRNVVLMGFSYDRHLPDLLEAFGRRAESLASRAFHGASITLPYDRCYYPDWNSENESPPPCGGSRQTPAIQNPYDRFTATEAILPGQAAMGAISWPPNTQTRLDEKRYNLDSPILSSADDWLFNYPALQGAGYHRPINYFDWLPLAQDDNPTRGFLKWWLSHLPRLPGHSNNKLNNWWEYVVNHPNHSETDN